MHDDGIGTGFSIRDRKAQDVDDELDIEGEDEDVFGDAQFTECDILPLQPDEEVDIEDDDGDGHGDSEPGPSTANNNTTLSRTSNASSRGRTLRDLVAAGKVAGHANSHTKGKAVVEKQLDINESVKAARDAGDTVALLHALERKIKALVSPPIAGVPAACCPSSADDAHSDTLRNLLTPLLHTFLTPTPLPYPHPWLRPHVEYVSNPTPTPPYLSHAGTFSVTYAGSAASARPSSARYANILPPRRICARYIYDKIFFGYSWDMLIIGVTVITLTLWMS